MFDFSTMYASLWTILLVAVFVMIGIVVLWVFSWAICSSFVAIFDARRNKNEAKRALIETQETNQIEKYERLCAELEEKLSKLPKSPNVPLSPPPPPPPVIDLRITRAEGEKLFFGYPTLEAFYRQVNDARFDRAILKVKPKEKITISCKFPAQSDSNKTEYLTSLEKCDCKDYEIHRRPCKHMLYLAYYTGILYLDKSRYKAANEFKNKHS